MSNTSRLFDAINGYCKIRQAARRDYINRRQELETAHGSQYYKDELEKARVKRESVLSVARIEARSVADNILARFCCIADIVSDKRGISRETTSLYVSAGSGRSTRRFGGFIPAIRSNSRS